MVDFTDPDLTDAPSYPHEYKTGHFVIHYDADSVPSRKDPSYTPLEKTDPGDILDGDPDWTILLQARIPTAS